MTSMPLDYERLLKDYTDRLVADLRGFGGDTQYLELWVPDDNLITSLTSMAEAAVASGQTDIAILLGPDTQGQVEDAHLFAALALYGEPAITPGEKGLLVEIANMHVRLQTAPAATAFSAKTHHSKAHQPAQPQADRSWVSSVHHAKTVGFGVAAHNRAPVNDEKLVPIQVHRDDIGLTLHVDPVTHIIEKISYTCKDELEHRGLMEAFCHQLQGLPILEAADHGASRLEFSLRDNAKARPVMGIVIPDTVGQGFAVLNTLIRDALASYRHDTGYAQSTNEFDQGPGQAWMKLDEAGRKACLEGAIGAFTAAQNLGPGSILIVAIEFDVRIVVRFSDEMQTDVAKLLLDLEETLQSEVDSRLELFLEERKDANAIRRLAE